MFGLGNLFKPKRISLEEQINCLSSLGMKLSPGIGVDQLLRSWSRDDLERRPFDLLVSMMGSTYPEGEPEGISFCPNVLWFDTECIYDSGDYSRMLHRLTGITNGRLRLDDVQDHYDYDSGVVWIKFQLYGVKHCLEPVFNGDWFDMEIVGRLSRLLQTKSPDWTFALRDPEDQTALIWCAKKDHVRKLSKITGIRFHLLD